MTSPLNDEPEFVIIEGQDADVTRKTAEEYWAKLDEDDTGPKT